MTRETAQVPVDYADPRSGRRFPRTIFRRRIANVAELPRLETEILGIVGLVIIIGLWQLLVSEGVLNELIFSSPLDVAESAKRLYVEDKLVPALVSTGKLFALSMAISIGIGIPLGVALGWYKRVEALLDPLLSLLYAMPRFALLPLIIAYAGIGFQSQVILVCTVAMPPILINTATGVATIARDHFQVARSYLATNFDLLRTVALPGSIPTVVAGVHQGILQGLLAVVVAEYFIGATGLGGIMFTAGITLKNGEALVGALSLGILAIFLTGALRKIERWLDKWRVA